MYGVNALLPVILFKMLKGAFAFNIQTIPKLNNKLDNIIRLGKDAFDKMEKTEVIYKFCCNNCSLFYVGESKRSLVTRLDEHKDSVNKSTVVSNHK